MRALTGFASRFSPKDRRALRWGGLVVVPSLVIGNVGRPVLAAVHELGGRIERERDLLVRERSLLADARGFQARYQATEHGLITEAPRLFGGPDLVTATAALGSYVSGFAAASRVMVQQADGGTPTMTPEGLARLQVEIRGVSDLQGLIGLLHAVEAGSKLAVVERITVQPAQAVTPGGLGDQEVLGFAATVVGYALADSASVARDATRGPTVRRTSGP